MQSVKKLFFLTSLLVLPAMGIAEETKPVNSGPDNLIPISLVLLVLTLLLAIGMLAHTLRQLSFVVREKIRKERSAGNIAKTVLLLMACILLPHLHSLAEGTTATQTASYVQGMPAADFYSLVAVIALEIFVIFMLAININVLLKIIKGTPETAAVAKVAPKASWFWDKFNRAASLEKEKDVLLDHNYDGIQELDNSLPPWWKYGFYLTIAVAVIYLYRYDIAHIAPSQEEEYAAEMKQGEEEKAAYLAKSANNVDESNVTKLTDAASLDDGKELFVKNCSPCHVADGGGAVGPNLTDDYWLHGGSIKDVFKSIKYGWQDKGMKSWKDDFTPRQIQELASFVKSLKGTHPAAPKAPQGDLYIEADQSAPRTDSTKTDSVKSEKIAVR